MTDQEKEFIRPIFKQFVGKYVQYLADRKLMTMVEYVEIESKLRKSRFMIDHEDFMLYVKIKRTGETIITYNCEKDYQKYIENQYKPF